MLKLSGAMHTEVCALCGVVLHDDTESIWDDSISDGWFCSDSCLELARIDGIDADDDDDSDDDEV